MLSRLREKQMKYIKLIIAVLLLSSCASQGIKNASYEAPQNVYFAGISFTGNFKDNKLNYPYSYDISKNMALDAIFAKKLQTLNNPHLNVLTSLGNTESSDALAISLAIDLETVSVSQISSSQYKLVADLYTQILVFDFNEKKVINSYTINLQYITLFDHKPDKKEISAIFEGFYTGENPEVKTNLFDLTIEKMNSIRIKPKYGNRLKVNRVEIAPEAKKILASLGQEEDNFKTIIAQSFSRYLVDNQQVAMLPYTKGQAIGSKMAARFVNGDIYNLEIPTADYIFNIDILNFKTLTDNAQSKTTQTHGFFAYTNIEMLQPDLNKKYMDSKFRGTEHVVLLNEQQPALKLSYLETLMNLFDDFSKNISKEDDEWYENTFDPSTFEKVEKEFEQVHEIINRCK